MLAYQKLVVKDSGKRVVSILFTVKVILFIFCRLTGSMSRGQQFEQGDPDAPVPSQSEPGSRPDQMPVTPQLTLLNVHEGLNELPSL